jgi:hypothetical protein
MDSILDALYMDVKLRDLFNGASLMSKHIPILWETSKQ